MRKNESTSPWRSVRPVIPQTRPGTDRGELRSLRLGVSRMGDATIALRADFVSIKVDCGVMTGIVRSMMMRRKRSDTWKVLVHSYITPEEFTICDLKSF